MDAPERQYLLQDSRSTTGTNLQFWADGGGYTTDIGRAERLSEEAAFRQNRARETDIPIPLAYLEARRHRTVDMQNVTAKAAADVADSHYYLQRLPQDWDGNNIVFLAAKGTRGTTDLDKARLVSHGELETVKEPHIAWPKSYIDGKSRFTVSQPEVKVAEALEGTGMTLTPIQKQRYVPYRCHGCGIFLRIGDYYGPGCPRCGTDNRP